MPTIATPEGLEDVVAGTTAICTVDGINGRLIYRGYDIRDLGEHATFEEVMYLLWKGDLPSRADLDTLNADLRASRALPTTVLERMRFFPRQIHPLHMLRTIVSSAAMDDPDVEDMSPEASYRKAVRLVNLCASSVAAWHRLRQGLEPVTPDAQLSHAANFLYMLNGERPSDVFERTMDVALTLHADHEFNASTFAGRVTAATLSDMHSAITSAIGALKGPLHGGANEAVISMLQAIGSLDRAEAHVVDALARKQRIMGFGHRVYRVEDPRAVFLRRMSRALGEQIGDLRWYEISEKVREVVKREKGLEVNVDFYSASTYYTMGIPTDLFTAVFAVSRVSGWTAHVMEQYAHNRLIRPRGDYIGHTDRQWQPIEQRTSRAA
jgi:citrate synthase